MQWFYTKSRGLRKTGKNPIWLELDGETPAIWMARSQVVWSHQRRVLHRIVQLEREELLWRVPAEILQAREGILVSLGLCEGEIDVVGAGC